MSDFKVGKALTIHPSALVRALHRIEVARGEDERKRAELAVKVWWYLKPKIVARRAELESSFDTALRIVQRITSSANDQDQDDFEAQA